MVVLWVCQDLLYEQRTRAILQRCTMSAPYSFLPMCVIDIAKNVVILEDTIDVIYFTLLTRKGAF